METEAKYIVPDRATFNRLKKARKIGRYSLQDTKTKIVHDRYLDTPERLFYGHKYFVRLRQPTNGGQPLLTIKSLGAPSEGAIHSREEYEAKVEGQEVTTWPESEPKRLARKIAGDKPLVDFVGLDQTRMVSILYDGKRVVAEVSVDEVMTQTPGNSTPEYELEIELLPDGTIDDLRAISALVEKAYHVAPQRLSKFERAVLRLAVPEPEAVQTPAKRVTAHRGAHNGHNGTAQPEGVTLLAEKPQAEPQLSTEKKRGAGVLPDDSMETAARKRLKLYYKGIRKNESGALSGDEERALHDMRVATRRMRAVLRVFGPYLRGPEPERLEKELTDLTRSVGAARDLDVLISDAEAFGSDLPEEQRGGLQGLIDEWRASRDKAQKKLSALLDSKEYARFKKGVAAYIKESGGTKNGATTRPRQVRHVAAGAIWRNYEAVRAFESVMDSLSDDQLHDLRIKAKYLRYTLECLREVTTPAANDLVRDLVTVQDKLGELHDAVLAHQMGTDYRKRLLKKAKNDAGGSANQDLDRYLEEREDTRLRLQKDFLPTWERIISPAWRSRLAEVAAAI